MRSSRLPPAASLNDTSMTFHGLASCRAAVNNIVWYPYHPNYPAVITYRDGLPTPNSERPKFHADST